MLAEVEKLQDEFVEWLPGFGSARKERERSAAQIFLNVLKIVSELQQHAPLESEPALFRIEPGLRETCIGEHAGSAFGAADTQ
jgi:hypothetical protein